MWKNNTGFKFRKSFIFCESTCYFEESYQNRERNEIVVNFSQL